MVSFTHEQNIICSQTLEAEHSWTTLPMSRPLFVCSYLQVTWWTFSVNEKDEQFASNDNDEAYVTLSSYDDFNSLNKLSQA